MKSENNNSQKREIDFKELEKKLTKKFSKIIFNEKLQQGKATLSAIFQKVSVKNPEKTIKSLRDYLESKIYTNIELYAVGQYSYMQKSGNWTEAGQDRVKLSYIRLMYDIPVDKEISFSDYTKFEEDIKTKQIFYGWDKLEASDILLAINSPEMELFGRKFYHTNTEEINILLELVESPRRIMMGLSGSGAMKSMIFGVANSTAHGVYKIYFLQKEEMRTPNNVHYIVAVIEKKSVAIRQEVCRYVFHSKWVPVMDYDLFQMEAFTSLPEESVSEAIKKATLQEFGVNNQDDLLKIEDKFVEAMVENLLYHEVAHDALEDGSLNNTELAMIGGMTSQADNILSVLTEVMTELMPDRNEVKGPIKNIVDTAITKGDPVKAKQMLLIYMSDGWFLDTDTEFMYPYNYIMFIIFQKYIEKGRNIDFISLFNNLNSIFDLITNWYRGVLAEVYTKVKSIKYKHDGKECNFKDMTKHIEEILKKYEDEEYRKNMDDDGKEGNFWINFFIQLNRLDKSSFDALEVFVQAKQEDLYKLLMSKFTTNKEQDKYGTDVRSFVIDKMLELGFSVDEFN